MKTITVILIGLALSGSVFAQADGAEEAGGKIDDAAAKASCEITDPWIAGKVNEQVMVDSLMKARHIKVDTQSHVVTLRGRVQSAEARDRALSIASNTDGVQASSTC